MTMDVRERGWRSAAWRWPPPGVWLWCGLSLFMALAARALFSDLDVVALPLGLVLGLVASVVVFQTWYWLIAPLAARAMSPAVAVRPPPSLVGEAEATWTIAPQPLYPALARARGQEGWVLLRLRADCRGRVRAYRIDDAAPDRTFVGAVANSLLRARLPKRIEGPRLREARTLVRFVMPTQDTGASAASARRQEA